MSSKRKFYKTIVQIEILSETPYSSTDLEKINLDITEGSQSGKIQIITDSEEIDARTCAGKLLNEHSLEPDFFAIDEHGNDIEDKIEPHFADDEVEEHNEKVHKLKMDKD